MLFTLVQPVQAEELAISGKASVVETAGDKHKNAEAYINLSPFTAIQTDVVADIRIIQKDCSRIEAKGPERIIGFIDASVTDGVLRITMDKVRHTMKNGEKVTLTVFTPTLTSIRQIGVGSIKCEGSLKTSTMTISNVGVGSVEMKDLQCDTLAVTSDGVGGIDLSGTTREAIYQSGGVGSIEAYDMHSESAKVVLNGVGTIHCHASRRIDVCNNGVGSIRYDGDPDQVNVSHNGVGSIHRR